MTSTAVQPVTDEQRRPANGQQLHPRSTAEPVRSVPVRDLSSEIHRWLTDVETIADWRSWSPQQTQRIRAATQRLLTAVAELLRLHTPVDHGWCAVCLPGTDGSPSTGNPCRTSALLVAGVPSPILVGAGQPYALATQWLHDTRGQLASPTAGDREGALARSVLPGLISSLRTVTALHDTRAGWCAWCLETAVPGQPQLLGCATVRLLHAHLFAARPPAPVVVPTQRDARRPAPTPARSQERSQRRGTQRVRAGAAS